MTFHGRRQFYRLNTVILILKSYMIRMIQWIGHWPRVEVPVFFFLYLFISMEGRHLNTFDNLSASVSICKMVMIESHRCAIIANV